MQLTYTFRLTTNFRLAFPHNPYLKKQPQIFYKTNSYQNILRSPHANKNAQEHFKNQKYIIIIKCYTQKEATNMLQYLKHKYSENILACVIYKKYNFLYKTFF
jgi:hypothetical protein